MECAIGEACRTHVNKERWKSGEKCFRPQYTAVRPRNYSTQQVFERGDKADNATRTPPKTEWYCVIGWFCSGSHCSLQHPHVEELSVSLRPLR
jgi:hypothetical protein